MINCIIVDDFETLRNIYKNILGFEKDITILGTAGNRRELFELLRKDDNAGKADVILLDIEMESRYDGIQVCKDIAELYPEIKVIILTCHEDDEYIIMALEAGAVDYINKSASLSELLQAIHSAYEGNSALNSRVSGIVRRHFKKMHNYKQGLAYFISVMTRLTPSELEILQLLLEGKRQKEIAQIRSVELNTIKVHAGNILKKFDCKRMNDVINTINDLNLRDLIETRR